MMNSVPVLFLEEVFKFVSTQLDANRFPAPVFQILQNIEDHAVTLTLDLYLDPENLEEFSYEFTASGQYNGEEVNALEFQNILDMIKAYRLYDVRVNDVILIQGDTHKGSWQDKEFVRILTVSNYCPEVSFACDVEPSFETYQLLLNSGLRRASEISVLPTLDPTDADILKPRATRRII